jgi:hypothetical protein
MLTDQSKHQNTFTRRNIMETGKKEMQAKAEILDARLKEWGIDLERFRAKASKANGEAKAKLESEVAVLQTHLNEARKNLDGFRKTGQAASGEMKKGIEDASAKLKTAFDRARAKFEQ